METEAPTKKPVRLFYRPALECVQSLLSHPFLAPHIAFAPRRVWTLAARICRLYEDWLSGDRAWAIQVSLPFRIVVAVVFIDGCRKHFPAAQQC